MPAMPTRWPPGCVATRGERPSAWAADSPRQRLGPRLAVEIESAQRSGARDRELLLLPAACGKAGRTRQLPRALAEEDLRVAAAGCGRGLGDELLRFSREPGQGHGHRLTGADALLAVRREDAADRGEAGGGKMRAPALGEAGIHCTRIAVVAADLGIRAGAGDGVTDARGMTLVERAADGRAARRADAGPADVVPGARVAVVARA